MYYSFFKKGKREARQNGNHFAGAMGKTVGLSYKAKPQLCQQ